MPSSISVRTSIACRKVNAMNYFAFTQNGSYCLGGKRGIFIRMVAPVRTPLERILDPLVECLNPESAKHLVRFRLDNATQARLDELAKKSNEGLLTEQERDEYRQYVVLIDI